MACVEHAVETYFSMLWSLGPSWVLIAVAPGHGVLSSGGGRALSAGGVRLCSGIVWWYGTVLTSRGRRCLHPSSFPGTRKALVFVLLRGMFVF